ncbi:class II fumarate hydratase [Thalassolituus oleivorans]|jgi:fumarate hydratase class II|uniref:class II fumarate hydratase n=1 Tax=Thalassolituus oleivorans TaxID=187493 RepID=UPI00042DD9D7|nr:class II fumarate hydratase [Thalassolituus oleivorans]AHK16736.1 fumarate hydratase [Thalassolituus oleivorans R6-15]|tara:strand:- start:37 stop:1422 length:1386 start_codon:yes stop_codon:yes gene_type:complete
MASATRIEHDSMGDLEVPAHALYGAQTQRAINNFNISQQTMPSTFIRALLQVKMAAAEANRQLDQLDVEIAAAIQKSAQGLLNSDDLMDHFPIDIFQTGSGTSTNMNANEVLAHLAAMMCGQEVNANDHVNAGQSSNDVIPTSIHVATSIGLAHELLPALNHLKQVMNAKAESLKDIVKTGRTHLMDAMPVRMDQTIYAWSNQIQQNIRNLEQLQPVVQSLAQGGTAVGTGINAHPDFAALFCQVLSQQTGLDFTEADNRFSQIASQDTAVAVSGQLKTLAVSLMKIANDLRWMNSGPLAGLGEIELEALQPGSSIMPGKVNPVIPEAVAMVAAQVIGNDTTITVAGQSGNFELNVMLPLIASNLLHSIHLLTQASLVLADKAIATFKVNEARLQEALARNPILVTALNPIIGYAKAAEIAKLAYREQRAIIDVAEEHTDLTRAELTKLLDPDHLTRGGLA